MSFIIIADSASDIEKSDREDFVILPMTITFGDTEYQDGINLTKREFFEKLIESDELPITSQIPPYVFEENYEKYKDHDVLVITMSSKLSGTFQSANIAAEDYPNVRILDSENVTCGENSLIQYALKLKDSGMNIDEVYKELEEKKKKIVLVGLLDTLEYLKKGGRISKAAAAIGGLLSIKPVISIQNGEVAMLGKARGSKQGNNLLVQEIEKAGGIDFNMPFCLAYSGLSDNLINKYIEDSKSLWECDVESLPICLLGGTIGTHIGPGAIAVAFFSK